MAQDDTDVPCVGCGSGTQPVAHKFFVSRLILEAILGRGAVSILGLLGSFVIGV